MSYGGDEDRGPFLNIINWVFCTIALILVRLFSRRLLEKSNLKIDDALIVFCMAFVLSRTIYVSVCISHGFGQHLHPMLHKDPVATTVLTRLLVILQALSLWTWTLPKIAVALLLTRLFGKHKRHVGVILAVLVGLLIIWVTALTIITFVKCSPVAKNWNPPLPGTCWDERIYLYMGYVGGAYSAALDFGFAISPMIQIWGLQMERSRRILVAVSLSLGILAGITSLYKVSTISTLLDLGDPTWATVPLEVWNSLESCALIIAVVIPMSRPVMVLMGKSLMGFMSQLTYSVTRSSRSENSTSNTIKYSSSAPSKDGGPEYLRQAAPSQGPNNSEEILLEETQYTRSKLNLWYRQ